jgi:hydroxypyruvate isomerase
MPRFAANLSFLYPDLPFLERFGAAAADGFAGVEYMFPYAHPAQEIAGLLRRHGLQQVLFNTAQGAWEQGERGIAALPGREAEFRAAIGQALAYAQALDCPRLHVMAGLVPQGAERATFVDNLRWAAAEAGRAGRLLVIEPINGRDMPGYFLQRQDEAHAVVADVGSPHVAVQMDLYHCQVVEGDLAAKLKHYLPTGRVGHLQIAGVPERHEPDEGEVNYPYLFELVDALGYDGWIGCEYRPRRGTSQGLGWLRRWRERPAGQQAAALSR